MKFLITEKQLRLFEEIELKSRANDIQKDKEEYIKTILKKPVEEIRISDLKLFNDEQLKLIGDKVKEKYDFIDYSLNEFFVFYLKDDKDISVDINLFFGLTFGDLVNYFKGYIVKKKYENGLNENYELSPGEQIEWDLENNTTKIARLDGSIEWILQNEEKTTPYLEKLFKTLNKGEIIDFGKRLLNKISSGGNKRKIIMAGLITTMINYGISKDDILHQFNDKDITEFLEKDLNIEPSKKFRGNIDDFLNLLAFKESSGNWKKIRYSEKTGNPVYIGKYQFGKIALEDLGINPEIISQFENNPNIFPPQMQDKLVKRLIKRNKKYLGNYLNYDGKKVGDVKVTTSGLIAAAHLRGALSVKKFLDSDGKIDLSDANGTKVSDYMKYFAGFEL
jgi:hypothetical protein